MPYCGSSSSCLLDNPPFTRWDRLLPVWLASLASGWPQALLLIQPDTLLRWHRELFKWVWQRKSLHTGGKRPVAPDIVALIREMARQNPLWGTTRIRGELLEFGIHVSKSTIQKYLSKDRSPRSTKKWTTFLHNHGDQIWACDFIQITNLWFRSLFAFVMIELGSRRVVHVGVTAHPTDAWVAQQVCESTLFGQGPRYLLRDNDRKYGNHVWAVTKGAGKEVLKTPLVRLVQTRFVCDLLAPSAAIPEFQLVDPLLHDRLWRRLLRDIVWHILPSRRNRTQPPVVKRKMSNFRLNRPDHRASPQPARPFADVVVVLPLPLPLVI